MTTKQQTAALLEQHETEYISGSAIADILGLTRAAVWKCVKQLEAEGYDIESTKKGYRLGENNNALSEGLIRRYLGDAADRISLEVLSGVDSTNNYLKLRSSQTPSWHAVIASEQTAGRGRMGRSFESPAGTGLYLSVLLRPDLPAQQAVRLTTAAAAAACLAIEECTDSKAGIKWVNDVFVNGKKTCGILTEASIDLESGGLDWAVMGIGFNVYEPEGGFTAEIRNIAGAITEKRTRDLRSRIAASFLRRYYDIVETRQLKDYSDEYIRRSFIVGKRVNVLRGGTSRPARALSIDDECRLLVCYDDGSTEALSSGEVSVRQIDG